MTPAERLVKLSSGNEPKLILKLPSGFAVIGDTQFLPGYSLLLAYPQVGQLNDLHGAHRQQFLEDMAALGDAVREATGCKRINYSIYGNLDPFLHVHVWPRYEWEEPAYATMPPFYYPESLRMDPAHAFDSEKHGELKEKIRMALMEI